MNLNEIKLISEKCQEKEQKKKAREPYEEIIRRLRNQNKFRTESKQPTQL
jgi:hypothetical protein